MKPAKPKTRTVSIRNEWANLKFAPAEVRRAVRALDRGGRFPCPPGELSLVFLGDEAMGRLHGEFLGDPAPTDVITFAGDPDMDFAGEICVSVDHALRYAAAHDADFSRELSLYLVHGYLHLAGFDDQTPEGRRRMRAAEKNALAALEISDNLPVFRVET